MPATVLPDQEAPYLRSLAPKRQPGERTPSSLIDAEAFLAAAQGDMTEDARRLLGLDRELALTEEEKRQIAVAYTFGCRRGQLHLIFLHMRREEAT